MPSAVWRGVPSEKEMWTMSSREAEEWIARGIELGEQERYAEAVEAYDRATALDPTNAEAWALKGGALADCERTEEALVAYDQALAPDPDEAAPRAFNGNTPPQLCPPPHPLPP